MAITSRIFLRRIDNGIIMTKDNKEIYYENLSKFASENLINNVDKALEIRKEIMVSLDIDEIVKSKPSD